MQILNNKWAVAIIGGLVAVYLANHVSVVGNIVGTVGTSTIA